MKEKIDIEKHIVKYFPVKSTEKIATELNISIHKVRSIAKKNNVKKSEIYLAGLKQRFIEERKRWYEANIPQFSPTLIQEQIIFGSILGDGYISKGAQRSKNYYYQEHFGESQRNYRLWKLSMLKNLGFKINGNYLRSISHPYFTNLHRYLYKENKKVLTEEFIKKCTHPAFLTTLYLDDGSLVLSYKYNKSKHTVYCHPSIILYTLNFTHEENRLLATHLNHAFDTNFVISGHPHGNQSLLKLNKVSEVRHLLNIIQPFTKQIPSMEYKSNIGKKLETKEDDIYSRYGKNVNIVLSSSDRNKIYSDEEINTLIQLKQKGMTDQFIADRLGRTYWSVVYKNSELKRQGLL